MKKTALILLVILPAILQAQTFTRKDGDTVGNQIVMSMPKAPAVYIQGLISYPDDYFQAKNANKKYPVFFFLHGAGQAANPKTVAQDINYMNADGLNQWLAASKANKPYGIDSATKDTVKWIVVSPHCTDNTQCSYIYQQIQYIVPYVLSNIRADTSCIWVGGLSAGGAGTWSCVMGDSTFGKQFAGIMPEANGGWDNFINTPAYKQNLIAVLKSGLATLAITGDQDPTYNDIGFKQYRTIDTTYAQKGKYYDSIPKGLAHVAAVWQQPWPLTARVWSKTMNSWSQMWSLKKKSPIKVNPVHASMTIDSSNLHWPNTATIVRNTSTGSTMYSVGFYSYPTNAPGIIYGRREFNETFVASLMPGGAYGVILIAWDNNGNTDTARAQITVEAPPRQPCPVCPPQRNAIGFSFDIINGVYKVTYDTDKP